MGMMMANGQSQAAVSGYQVVNTYPHDRGAFCQGLLISDGKLIESTGQYGNSTLRIVDLETGKVQRQVRLNNQTFAEGIAVAGDMIVQLTWKQQRAFVFKRDTLEYVKAFRYSGQGWGLTFDGKQFILSDGSSRLRFMNATTFRVERTVSVHDGRRRIDNINELEYVNGEIYANIWYSDSIARISPKDGSLLGWIDLHTLWPQRNRPSRENVLNGIAYDKENNRLFVTGKNWPNLFEIRVTNPQP